MSTLYDATTVEEAQACLKAGCRSYDLNPNPAYEEITPFVHHCILGNIDIVKLLFEYNAKINGEYYVDPQAFARVCLDGHTDIFDYLVGHVDDINNTDHDPFSRTYIYDAVYGNNYDILLRLLEKGCNPKILDNTNSSAVNIAAFYGYICLLDPLYLYGADLFLQDDYGRTPLHNAVIGNQVTACEYLLLMAGNSVVHLTVQDNQGKTAYDLAVQHERTEILKLFNSLLHN